jgi:Pentapeptide repeats (8 copies)
VLTSATIKSSVEWGLSFFSWLLSFVSSSGFFFLAVVVVLILLWIYFNRWWVAPKNLVPPHLTRLDLQHLELQDRLRRTNIQVPIVISLVLMFGFLIAWFVAYTGQWASDYQLRADQNSALQFAEATKALAEPSTDSHLAGIYSLQYLANQDAKRNERRTTEILAAFVRKYSLTSVLGQSFECNGVGDGDREEAPEDLQAAMNVLGSRDFAPNRRYRFDERTNSCELNNSDTERTKYGAYRIVLEHRYLDDLNLTASEFSCAKFSASRFRRTSFEWAHLRGTEFDAADLGARYVPGFAEAAEAAKKSFSEDKRTGQFSLAKWLHDEEPPWRQYRCWVTFFRGATLDKAKFDGSN